MKAFQFVPGSIIKKAGAYIGVPITEYHSGMLCHGFSISSTGLRRVLESPAHFWATHPLNPDCIEDEDGEKQALIFGSACHCNAFEPELFAAQFLALPADAPKRPSARQRNAIKKSVGTLESIEFWDKVAEQNKAVLTSLDFEDVQAMSGALRKNQMARNLFSGGAPEITYAAKVCHATDGGWRKADESEDGIWLLARPDYTPFSASRRLLDYKTAASAKPDKWSRHAFDLGYDIQAALALWVFEMATGEKRGGIAHIIQEKKPPFVIQTGDWLAEDIEEAMSAIFDGLDRLSYGIKTDEWPAYSGEAFNIIKPKYLRKQEIAA